MIVSVLRLRAVAPAERWLVRLQVRLAARRIGIELGDAVIMVTIPTAWDVVRPLPVPALALNRSDLHSAFEETDQALIT